MYNIGYTFFVKRVEIPAAKQCGLTGSCKVGYARGHV